MLNPAIGKLIKEYDNRYKLVLDVAKEARDIAVQNEDDNDKNVEKSVTLAINKIAEDK